MKTMTTRKYQNDQVSAHKKKKTDAPARNTRSQRRTLTQEVIYSCMDITYTPATPRKLASRKFPMKFLCEIAGAVVGASTGELLEYRHLRINPQYRQVWGKYFGNEIGSLAQGIPNRVDRTDTMFLIDENEIPRNRRGDATYGRIVCDIREGKTGKKKNKIDSRRQSHQLSWRCRNANRMPPDSKTVSQQCGINGRSRVHDSGN